MPMRKDNNGNRVYEIINKNSHTAHIYKLRTRTRSTATATTTKFLLAGVRYVLSTSIIITNSNKTQMHTHTHTHTHIHVYWTLFNFGCWACSKSATLLLVLWANYPKFGYNSEMFNDCKQHRLTNTHQSLCDSITNDRFNLPKWFGVRDEVMTLN